MIAGRQSESNRWNHRSCRLRWNGPIALLLIAFVCPKPADGMAWATAPQQKDKRTEDLSKRLIRGESAHTDAMGRIISRMEEVERKLTRSFDPGPETQAMQQRIIDDLDAAIAAAVRRGARGTPGDGQPGDQRRRTRRSMGPQGAGNQAGSSQSNRDTARSTSEPARSGLSGPFRESRRGWGHLPPRDRQEVIQGLSEQSLEKFRQWIERYYKALAEGDRE